ncbi:TBC1 domain family member 5 [Golovinomyces cichoracearum]|uniref:TBC1 domain family member 5 n=1 Tax=Golovinomyces cichoracearum TaxID=62708 RepID=A0A420IXZ4_9PEZI|nr:TBC1 domain family member 5 [Golovinomyces cichoracearum]
MRSLDQARRQRWQLTKKYIGSKESLKRAVRENCDTDPCSKGLRSVFWKIFLLLEEKSTCSWSKKLAESRKAYTHLRQYHLRYIDDPDQLKFATDPLDNNINSPWNTYRKNEEIRSEIFQDIERCMPDDFYFQNSRCQKMLLDILFIFCKINQNVGYRQGMHELLAPLFWVIDQDAIDLTGDVESKDVSGDELLLREILDHNFIEHDSFILFSLLMRSAMPFYEPGGPVCSPTLDSDPSKAQIPLIIKKSQRIHEVYLAQLDPELANHLSQINVLPQIFLIRWIRLLFGREFCFSQLLSLWDVLLVEGPSLNLVDMVCVAMLLRIRWQLIETGSSSALRLLLNYPSMKAPHKPKHLVDDALFLRDNLSLSGGAKIILKYSGKLPKYFVDTSESTPELRFDNLVQKNNSSPTSLHKASQQSISFEGLLQEAFKGVYNRGERLGINQIVRETVGEVKKNMQGLEVSMRSPDTLGWTFGEERLIPSPKANLAVQDFRNQRLANMLEQATTDLRKASASGDKDTRSYVGAIEMAIAKVDLVKVYLEDSTMLLPEPSTL